MSSPTTFFASIRKDNAWSDYKDQQGSFGKMANIKITLYEKDWRYWRREYLRLRNQWPLKQKFQLQFYWKHMQVIMIFL